MSPHKQGDSQVEWRESSNEWKMISRCVDGHLACARTAELLDLSPRQIQRLKARYRQGGAAALSHANRGRPSHRRLPQRSVQPSYVWPARRYAGFG